MLQLPNYELPALWHDPKSSWSQRFLQVRGKSTPICIAIYTTSDQLSVLAQCMTMQLKLARFKQTGQQHMHCHKNPVECYLPGQ